MRFVDAPPAYCSNAPHDPGLDRFDAEKLAWGFRIGRVGLDLSAVPVHPAACPEPGERATFEAAVYLGLHELQERIVDERERSEREPGAGAVGRHARGAVDHPDVGCGEVLEDDAPGVAEVARESGEVIAEDRPEGREPAAARRGEKALHVRALEEGACGRGSWR